MLFSSSAAWRTTVSASRSNKLPNVSLADVDLVEIVDHALELARLCVVTIRERPQLVVHAELG